MSALFPVILSSLLVCFLLTPFFRDFFAVLGKVDKPDTFRKAHPRPIPRVGGIALMTAYSVALIALGLSFGRGVFDPRDPTILLVIKLSPAIVIIFLVGLYDDLKGLSPGKKLLGELVAAGYASWIGIRLATPGGYTGPAILLDLLGIFWLVLCANAFNLIDGLDGLATGVALIAASSLLLAAIIHHDPSLALVITPLVGALLGFLYYNFNPASIFLGDCGSLLIGFLLGCYGLIWNQHGSSGLGVSAPFVALAFPIFEVVLSIGRRFLRHRPIFSSDRNHIHHRIQSLGLSHRNTALVLYAVTASVAMVAVLLTILQPRIATVLVGLFCAAAFIGFRSLRYSEFGIFAKFLFAGGFRRTLRSSIHLHEYEEQLATARTLDDCWKVLRNTCSEANFSYVAIRIHGREFEEELIPNSGDVHKMRVNLSRLDEAVFGYDPDLTAQAMLIVPLAERLQEKVALVAPPLSGSLAENSGRDRTSAVRAAAF